MTKNSQQATSTPPAMAPLKRTRTYTTDVVMVDKTPIRTTVTNSGAAVERFLGGVIRHNDPRHLLVGIDTEWRMVYDRPDGKPSHHTAVLQLCVGRHCLVFQIVHADYIPKALADFLACKNHRFAGVEVAGDFKRLSEDYGLPVTANTIDLRTLAAEVLCRPELKRAGLKTLTHVMMSVLIDKPKRVTLSRWGNYRLSQEQVDYACIDAFTSYEVGRLLLDRQCAAIGAATAAYAEIPVPTVASGVRVCQSCRKTVNKHT